MWYIAPEVTQAGNNMNNDNRTDNFSESALIDLLDAKLDTCKKALQKIAMGTSSEDYPWIAIEKEQMKDIAQKALREIDR